jgi:hypothetical protein
MIKGVNDSSLRDPAVVNRSHRSVPPLKTVFAAVALGLFDALAGSSRSGEELAQELQLEPLLPARVLADYCMEPWALET